MRAVVGFCAALAGLGCGGDKTGATSDSNSASESNSSGGSGEPTETSAPTEGSGSLSATDGSDGGSMSASMSGTTEISGGMSASMSGSNDSGNESGGGTSSTSTGMLSGGGETSLGTSSTGEPVNCNFFEDEEGCVGAGCMAIEAQLFFDDGATWCLHGASFLSCAEPGECDGVITTACKGQTKYQFPNGCLPPGFMTCDAPPDAGMDGYPDCN
jgi:hypothetical protein